MQDLLPGTPGGVPGPPGPPLATGLSTMHNSEGQWRHLVHDMVPDTKT